MTRDSSKAKPTSTDRIVSRSGNLIRGSFGSDESSAPTTVDEPKHDDVGKSLEEDLRRVPENSLVRTLIVALQGEADRLESEVKELSVKLEVAAGIEHRLDAIIRSFMESGRDATRGLPAGDAIRPPPGSAVEEDQDRAPAGSTGLPETHESGASAWDVISRGGLPVPDEDSMSSQHVVRPTYPKESFEAALLKGFPDREDIQDFARHNFYEDFDPRVESYEYISDDELDEIRSFLVAQQAMHES